MAKHTPSAKDLKRVRKIVRQARIRSLVEVIIDQALEVAAKTGAYDDGTAFQALMTILKRVPGELRKRVVAELDKVRQERLTKGLRQCNSDADCPPDYICDNRGKCVWIFSD